MGAADTPLFAAEEAKKALIGLARDLRGLAFAFNTKSSYMMLFDWMYVYVIYKQCILYLVYICIIKKHIFISCIILNYHQISALHADFITCCGTVASRATSDNARPKVIC